MGIFTKAESEDKTFDFYRPPKLEDIENSPKCIGIPIIIIGFLRKFLLRPKYTGFVTNEDGIPKALIPNTQAWTTRRTDSIFILDI